MVLLNQDKVRCSSPMSCKLCMYPVGCRYIHTFSASAKDIKPSGFVSLSYVCSLEYLQGMSNSPTFFVPREESITAFNRGASCLSQEGSTLSYWIVERLSAMILIFVASCFLSEVIEL